MASLEYPRDIQDAHQTYPLCPKHGFVEDNELSPHARRLWQKLNPPPPGTENPEQYFLKRPRVKKLINSLYDKDNCILHYRNLQLCLQQGMKLKKIHRVLTFHQAPYLKPFIKGNIERRKHARNEFEKMFWKLVNNAVYGKSVMLCSLHYMPTHTTTHHPSPALYKQVV